MNILVTNGGEKMEGKCLQDERTLLAYANAQEGRAGGFLSAFLEACRYADPENYALLRPLLIVLTVKYPASPDRLRRELE